METRNEPPAVGASLMVEQLTDHRDWIIEGKRDLELMDGWFPEVLDGDWRPLVRRAREVLDGYEGRLSIHGPWTDAYVWGCLDPRLRDLIVDRLRQAIAFAAELEADHVVLHSPFHFFGASPFIPHSPTLGPEAGISTVRAAIEEVLPLAEQAGRTLVIENIRDANVAPLLALVRSFGSEHVRLCLDVGHAFIAYREGGPPPDQWVRESGPLLAHLHLQDTDGNHDRHWPPGEGELNWFALFEALAGLEHGPPLILELTDMGPGAFARRGLAGPAGTRSLTLRPKSVK